MSGRLGAAVTPAEALGSRAGAMAKSKASKADEQAARAAFAANDVNGDGVLTYKEMAAALRAHASETGAGKLPARTINEFFDKFDVNEDAQISIDEWIAHFGEFSA